uniref:Uncharacterized protein n=1 Tax=Anguilla anguilla TaxID=7936 RepID=A0A0E9W8E0_ANGAN
MSFSFSETERQWVIPVPPTHKHSSIIYANITSPALTLPLMFPKTYIMANNDENSNTKFHIWS